MTNAIRAGAAFTKLAETDPEFRRALEGVRLRSRAFAGLAARVGPIPTGLGAIGAALAACPNLPPVDFTFGATLSRLLNQVKPVHPLSSLPALEA